MNGFALRIAGRCTSAVLAIVSVGCTASHAYKPTVSAPLVEGSVVQVSSKDSGPGRTVEVAAAASDKPAAVAHASSTTAYASTSDCGNCNGCGNGNCGGRCGNGCGGGLHQKLRECDWEQLRTDHCWPEQYNYESRRRVNQPLHDQIASGHATHNSLFDFHFETKAENRGELNQAGKMRLAYFARRKPYVVPSVFVQSSFDPKLDEVRNQHVRDFLATVSVEPTDWQVASVNSTPTGLYAQEGAYSIQKMIGPRAGGVVPTPFYERILKNNFFLGTGGGQETTGGGGS
jgi:hypothetical protein